MTYKGWTKLDLHVFQFFVCLLGICVVLKFILCNHTKMFLLYFL